MSLQEQLEELKSQTLAKIEAAKELAAVETIRVETLGKKGRSLRYYVECVIFQRRNVQKLVRLPMKSVTC